MKGGGGEQEEEVDQVDGAEGRQEDAPLQLGVWRGALQHQLNQV